MVVDVEYTGRHTVASVALTGAPAGSTLHVFLPPRSAVQPGEALQVAVDGTRAHVFDADTGRALWHPVDATDRDEA